MSAESPTVTDESAFTQASLGIQVLLFIVTLGIYGIYWYYSRMVELNNGTNVHLSPGIYTIFLFIPFAHLYTFWKVSEGGEAVTDQTQVVLFLLFFFGITSPIAWYLIQSGINRHASGS